MTRMMGPRGAAKVLRRLPGDPLGIEFGSYGRDFADFFEIQSRITVFQKITVFLWRGHVFRGFGGLENHAPAIGKPLFSEKQ
jgi:hypothetical protein